MSEEIYSSDVNKVDNMSSMKAFQRIWKLLLEVVISICCKHTELLGVTNVSGTYAMDLSASREREEVRNPLKTDGS